MQQKLQVQKLDLLRTLELLMTKGNQHVLVLKKEIYGQGLLIWNLH